MWLQAAGIGFLVVGRMLPIWLSAAILLGLDTVMVYPTLLAVASDVAHLVWRGTTIGVYRLWRDRGFALCGILAGLLADVFNLSVAIASIRVLTFLSGLVVLTVMRETVPSYQIPRHASS